MKREIKFRAWARDIMVDVVSIDFLNQYITWDGGQYDRCLPPNKCYEIDSFEDIIVMQFTGLVDKNGVEIYEGDVVLYRWHDDTDGIKSIVQFKDGEFGYSNSMGYFISYAQNYWFKFKNGESSFIEVIGNIYQNPELLK